MSKKKLPLTIRKNVKDMKAVRSAFRLVMDNMEANDDHRLVLTGPTGALFEVCFVSGDVEIFFWVVGVKGWGVFKREDVYAFARQILFNEGLPEGMTLADYTEPKDPID